MLERLKDIFGFQLVLAALNDAERCEECLPLRGFTNTPILTVALVWRGHISFKALIDYEYSQIFCVRCLFSVLGLQFIKRPVGFFLGK